jgi:hypothetical protein
MINGFGELNAPGVDHRTIRPFSEKNIALQDLTPYPLIAYLVIDSPRQSIFLFYSTQPKKGLTILLKIYGKSQYLRSSSKGTSCFESKQIIILSPIKGADVQ